MVTCQSHNLKIVGSIPTSGKRGSCKFLPAKSSQLFVMVLTLNLFSSYFLPQLHKFQ